MPFPYLGLPMGTTKPSIEDLLPIVEGWREDSFLPLYFFIKEPDFS
jgi:hypothetical protein